jgi:hypothetical protein
MLSTQPNNLKNVLSITAATKIGLSWTAPTTPTSIEAVGRITIDGGMPLLDYSIFYTV